MNPKLPQSRRARRAALGAELRRLRQLAGLSGRSLANRLGIKQERLSRIESGGTPASLPLVFAWADAVNATGDDRAHLRWMTEQALTEIIPLREWRDEDGMPSIQGEIRSLEETARSITNFQPCFVPGLLQTGEYARRLLATFTAPDALDAAAAARLNRQAILHDPGRQFEFILTEAALRWRTGPPGMLMAQFDRIANVATLPNVTVSVIPLGADMHTAPTCAFVLYDDRDDDEPPLAAVETPHARLEVTDKDDHVQAYRDELDLLRRSALSGEDAVAYIRDLAASL